MGLRTVGEMERDAKLIASLRDIADGIKDTAKELNELKNVIRDLQETIRGLSDNPKDSTLDANTGNKPPVF